MNFDKEDATHATPWWARSATAVRNAAAPVAWVLRSEGGVTATVALVPATVVTGCANLAAHDLMSVRNGVAAAAVFLASGFLGVKGLSHKWVPAASWTFLGTAGITLDLSVAVAGSGYMDLFAWAALAAASLGGRLAYLHGTSERRAKVRLMQAKEDQDERKVKLAERKAKDGRKDARLRAELADRRDQRDHELMVLKHQMAAEKLKTERVERELKEARLAKLNEPEPQPYRPNLTSGFEPEEAALRVAFWDVYEVELLGCHIEQTQTGYNATIGLPVGLSRDQVRTQWDKISSALRAEGRFVLANGRLTNELVAKFLDVNRRSSTDVTWNLGHLSQDPGKMSLGINTETGEPVLIHADERTLICGASGTGKSWSARALMAHAHFHGDLVLIDGKGEEGTVWNAVARVVIEADAILAMIDELHDEMNRRKLIMRNAGLSVWDRTQLTAVIDEGQVVLALIQSEREEAKARMQKLRELSSLGRSRGVVLWWATQKPVMSGSAPGIDNLIAPNMLQRFSLRVADEQEARTALDDCAHYAPNLIPDDRSMRGHGYLKGFGPSLIQTWTMDDAAVRSLPVKKWSSPAPQGGATDADKVARYFLANPDASNRQAEAELGFSEKKIRGLRKAAVVEAEVDLADVDPWAG